MSGEQNNFEAKMRAFALHAETRSGQKEQSQNLIDGSPYADSRLAYLAKLTELKNKADAMLYYLMATNSPFIMPDNATPPITFYIPNIAGEAVLVTYTAGCREPLGRFSIKRVKWNNGSAPQWDKYVAIREWLSYDDHARKAFANGDEVWL